MRHLPGPALVFIVQEPQRLLAGFYVYPGRPPRRYRRLIPAHVLASAPRLTEAEARARGWLTGPPVWRR